MYLFWKDSKPPINEIFYSKQTNNFEQNVSKKYVISKNAKTNLNIPQFWSPSRKEQQKTFRFAL